MFEQGRYTEDRRTRGLFQGEGGRAPGTERFQVSGENDPAELRAESMADSVAGGGGLFRSPEGSGGSGFQADLDTADLGDAGESLPAGLQSSMEQSFGTEFSGVRIHTGAGADRASRSISARAFTKGQDVYFRDGDYDPSSREGRHLIAHELAHVAAGDGGIHRYNTIGMSKAEILELAMGEAVKNCQEDLAEGKELADKFGFSEDKLIEEFGAGHIDRKEIRSGAGKVETVEHYVGVWIEDLEKNTAAYLEELKEGAASPEQAQTWADKNDKYAGAKEVLSQLKEVKQRLSVAKPSLKALRDSIGESGEGAENAGFPETVVNMLDDAACGQFFKAVEDIHAGAADVKNFEDLNQTAADAAVNRDVEESGAEKVSRISGNVSTVAGIGSSVADVISGGAGIDDAANGENTHNQNAGTKGTILGLASGAVGTGADAVGMAADAKALHDQEAERKRKIQEMQQRSAGTGIGKVGAADHAGRAAVAGSAAGVLGGAAGVVSSSADLAGDEKTSEIAGVTSASLGTAGDAIGLAVDSQNIKERRNRDKEAKQNMRALGKQLRATLFNSGIMTGKDLLILQISDKLKGEKFNAKGSEQLGVLIDRALDTSAPSTSANANTNASANANTNAGASAQANAPANTAQGELTPKQKNLLITLKALETSRMANKGAIAEARKDVGFGVTSLVGSLTSLAGSIASMAGSKLAGSILSMVGTAIGMVGTIRNAIGLKESKADQQQDRNDARDAKVAACQAAVGQMAALPALRLDTLKIMREKRMALSNDQQAAAEQYASVFSLIKTADVNMVDFLYAVEKGEFGKVTDPGTGKKKSAADSLEDMYGSLDFTN